MSSSHLIFEKKKNGLKTSLFPFNKTKNDSTSCVEIVKRFSLRQKIKQGKAVH